MQLNDPIDEGRMGTTTATKGKPMTILNQEDPRHSAILADFESQEAMMAPFLLSFKELEEVINSSERDGVCSDKVAEAAREDIKVLMWELDLLILKKVQLHQQFRAAEKVSEYFVHRSGIRR